MPAAYEQCQTELPRAPRLAVNAGNEPCSSVMVSLCPHDASADTARSHAVYGRTRSGYRSEQKRNKRGKGKSASCPLRASRAPQSSASRRATRRASHARRMRVDCYPFRSRCEATKARLFFVREGQRGPAERKPFTRSVPGYRTVSNTQESRVSSECPTASRARLSRVRGGSWLNLARWPCPPLGRALPRLRLNGRTWPV